MSALTTTNQEEIAKKELFKRTFCKGLNNDEFELFRTVCEYTGLSPATKQIYAVKRGDKMTIQTGIDGLRAIAERTGNYCPGKETSYTYDKDNNLISATAYLKKRTNDGIWHDVSATAFFAEYSVDGTFWRKMPHVMIAKCAEALAIRKAFPAITANLYTPEEMGQAGKGTVVTGGKEEETVEIIESKAAPLPETASPLEKLKHILDCDGIDSSKLDEWIAVRAQIKNESPEHIIDKCLNPQASKMFKESYIKYTQVA
jgi:phage recombination protein Bet